MRAVRAGSDQAAMQLATMYLEGRGVARDRVKSYLLLKWAALDSERAKNHLAELKATMSEAELNDAEKAWADWRP